MAPTRIRRAINSDAGPLARVHVDTWRTAYAGVVPADYLAGLSYEARESRWNDIFAAGQPATSTFVAETDMGEIIGFASGGPERLGNPAYEGEIYAVYVLQEHQRLGVGRRVFDAVVQQLLRDGFASMMLWVLEDNRRARRFYESMGGEQVGQRTITIGGADLTELSYGWKDISGIA
ncbi:MAG: GNAT family N-acetyltransferase [Acidimicrobiaceae bacterium]|nr:GNAT family N-acetyltransferase [Acidimicrobiaceae bacterium]MYH77501.1 GNAT family N-acetyltransferase [Acidimicrobiaceae bacterium]MYK75455.1 GNAT family N-acetyltransferase [Acidimicrobiaceae bacterium]